MRKQLPVEILLIQRSSSFLDLKHKRSQSSDAFCMGKTCAVGCSCHDCEIPGISRMPLLSFDRGLSEVSLRWRMTLISCFLALFTEIFNEHIVFTLLFMLLLYDRARMLQKTLIHILKDGRQNFGKI